MRHIKNPLHRANAQAQREFSFIADGRKYLVRLNLLYAYGESFQPTSGRTS